MQRQSRPIDWRGRGLSDALDGSSAFKGAMASLQNLIPDPSTQTLWQCRPASVELFNFVGQGGPFSSGFSSGFSANTIPFGFISCWKVVGNFLYGMINSGIVPGFDLPFCFNLLTDQLITVGGTQNNQTLPASPPSTGAWIPPQMAVIGTKLMVCHSGFTGAAGNFVGWFDLTVPSAPVWNAGNLTGDVSFVVAPTGVTQFSGRAYYIVNAPTAPAVVFSDPLDATNCTNANQVLTFGDNIALTAIAGLPLLNQLGGIVQSCMVFKGVVNIYQITGDAATSNLSINSLNIATGTLAPNTLAATPKGLAFIAPDGLRVIGFTGQVSDPIGLDGRGVTVPFIYSTVPSRMVAACNGSLLRISTQNGNISTNPQQEYWYDFGRQIWTGPHTFPASLIQPYNNTFIVAPIAVQASIWRSDPVQSSTSLFVENGTQMAYNWQPVLLPDTDQITNNCTTEATIDLALPPTSNPINITALDQNLSSINSVSIAPVQTVSTIWGAFTWGSGALWGSGAAANLAPYQIPWTIPIVFSRMAVSITGNSIGGLRIGAYHQRFQILRQLTNTQAAA